MPLIFRIVEGVGEGRLSQKESDMICSHIKDFPSVEHFIEERIHKVNMGNLNRPEFDLYIEKYFLTPIPLSALVS